MGHTSDEAWFEITHAFPRLPGEDEDWWHTARCSVSTECAELFYSEKTGSAARAKRICAECPARTECLDYAQKHGESHGIWGGLTGHERRVLALRG
ncbi:WhiB family transcriptional regulator [Streptomyces sp. BI20]|uniref:WhiB family transcriptional regulator n=1 Tax=Streptomyces sp. BI20 TaxID=3403460 RepID=UPI003C7772BE